MVSNLEIFVIGNLEYSFLAIFLSTKIQNFIFMNRGEYRLIINVTAEAVWRDFHNFYATYLKTKNE